MEHAIDTHFFLGEVFSAVFVRIILCAEIEVASIWYTFDMINNMLFLKFTYLFSWLFLVRFEIWCGV